MSKSPFKWHTSWSGIVLTDDNLLLPNTWNFTLEYDVVSENMLHRDIAMQRLEFMIEEKFNTSVWANFENPLVSEFHDKLNTFIITIPSDPHDSVIAGATMLKAQSITKNVFDIHSCSISGKLGYGVENIIEYSEAAEMGEYFDHKYFSDGAWFMRSDAGFTDMIITEDDTTTLIKDTVDWSSVDLNWDFFDQKQDNVASININKHDRWIPLVIKGGANNKDED